jgi:hypothetical protein
MFYNVLCNSAMTSLGVLNTKEEYGEKKENGVLEIKGEEVFRNEAKVKREMHLKT